MTSNMYEDAIYRWNVFVGCEFDCAYCKKSFKAQMKRQKHMIGPGYWNWRTRYGVRTGR